jgi:hypothetical protein
MFIVYMQEVHFKKFYNFQFILRNFLLRIRGLNRKFQLQDLRICALA